MIDDAWPAPAERRRGQRPCSDDDDLWLSDWATELRRSGYRATRLDWRMAAVGGAALQLPAGWATKTSRSTGGTYFVNTVTGERHPHLACRTRRVHRRRRRRRTEQRKGWKEGRREGKRERVHAVALVVVGGVRSRGEVKAHTDAAMLQPRAALIPAVACRWWVHR